MSAKRNDDQPSTGKTPTKVVDNDTNEIVEETGADPTGNPPKRWQAGAHDEENKANPDVTFTDADSAGRG